MININAYKKLINNDAKWIVDNTENSIERRHILKVLWASINGYCPDASDSTEQCEFCGETHPVLFCENCGHTWT